MNRTTLKIIIMICVFIATLLMFTIASNAATLSISTSKSTVSPGETFTVTVTLNGGAGTVKASVSNGTGSGSDFLDNNSLTFKCKAGESGSVIINASGTVADYSTEKDENISATPKTVTIQAPTPDPTPVTPAPTPDPTPVTPTPPSNDTTTKPVTKPTTTQPIQVETKSSNSKLATLQIAEGVITPEFNSSVKEYTISVPNEITKLSISATPDHSKATVTITGNEELKIGENIIEIIVKAEDGSRTTYKILATRALPELNLQALSMYYIDGNGEKINLAIEPEFVQNIYEYKIQEKLSYKTEKIQIEAIATRENANIEITGNEELNAGKNEITIKVILKDEAGLEEQKTYTIILEREEEPVVVPLTTMQKIKNWFSHIGASIGEWTSANIGVIIKTMLCVSTIALVGITIYLAYDYKNYQKLLAKLSQYNKENLNQRANVALNPEVANSTEENAELNGEKTKVTEENSEKISEQEQISEELKESQKNIKGKRFK